MMLRSSWSTCSITSYESILPSHFSIKCSVADIFYLFNLPCVLTAYALISCTDLSAFIPAYSVTNLSFILWKASPRNFWARSGLKSRITTFLLAYSNSACSVLNYSSATAILSEYSYLLCSLLTLFKFIVSSLILIRMSSSSIWTSLRSPSTSFCMKSYRLYWTILSFRFRI